MVEKQDIEFKTIWKYECPLPELYMDKGGTMILCKASERYMKLLNAIGLSNDTINGTINDTIKLKMG